MADSVIARLVAEITGDTSGLKSSVREAEGEFGKVEDKAKKAGKAAGDSFAKAGAKIEKSTEGIRKFSGAISSTVGIVTGLIGAITAVIAVFSLLTSSIRKSVSANKDLKKSIDDVTKSLEDRIAANQREILGQSAVSASLVDIKKEEQAEILKIIEDAEKVIAGRGGTLSGELLQNIFSVFGFETNSAVIRNTEDAVEAIRKRYDDLAASIRETNERNQRETAEAFRSSLSDQARAMEASLFGDEDRLLEQGRIQKEAVVKAAREAGVAVEDIELQRVLRVIDKKTEAEIAALVKVSKKREDVEVDASKRIAKQYADAIRSELQGVTDDIFGSSGGFTTRLDTLVQELRRVRSDVQGLKQ